jgi:hypothetical protein
VSRVRRPEPPELSVVTYAADRVRFLRRWSRSLILDGGRHAQVPDPVKIFEPELVERVELLRQKAGSRFAVEMIRGEIND